MEQGFRVAPGRPLRQCLVGVAQHATDRRRRRLPGDDPVQYGAERVEIGPGPLPDAWDLGELFDRCIARLEHDGQRLAHVADHAPRGAEVEQHRLACRRQQDVVGRDVPVQAVLPVQQLQGIEQRPQQSPDPRFVGRVRHRLHRGLEGRALVVGHDQIGGVVRLPEAVHLDQGRVVEARQQPGLVDEALESLGVAVGMALRAQHHRLLLAACCQRRWQVFLQRDPAQQQVVVGLVDHAEAAFTYQSGDLEFVQPGALGQQVMRAVRVLGGRLAPQHDGLFVPRQRRAGSGAHWRTRCLQGPSGVDGFMAQPPAAGPCAGARG